MFSTIAIAIVFVVAPFFIGCMVVEGIAELVRLYRWKIRKPEFRPIYRDPTEELHGRCGRVRLDDGARTHYYLDPKERASAEA